MSDKQADTIEEQKPHNDSINKITRAGKYSKLRQPRDEEIPKKTLLAVAEFSHMWAVEKRAWPMDEYANAVTRKIILPSIVKLKTPNIRTPEFRNARK